MSLLRRGENQGSIISNKKTPEGVFKSGATVKEQPVQEYLTDSSGILEQLNLKT